MGTPNPHDHYFARRPRSPTAPGTVHLTLPGLSVELATDRGVFAAGGVDPGTKLLLLEAPAPPTRGDVLDLGCGYGPIAVTLALRAPAATVWAVDTNERALGLCRANAAAAGAGARVRVAAPEEVPTDVRFAAIYSNPPIRVGKRVLLPLLEHWLARLAHGGHAYLVVHRHLGSDSLARWLDGRGHRVSRLCSRGGYRVLDVQP